MEQKSLSVQQNLQPTLIAFCLLFQVIYCACLFYATLIPKIDIYSHPFPAYFSSELSQNIYSFPTLKVKRKTTLLMMTVTKILRLKNSLYYNNPIDRFSKATMKHNKFKQKKNSSVSSLSHTPTTNKISFTSLTIYPTSPIYPIQQNFSSPIISFSSSSKILKFLYLFILSSYSRSTMVSMIVFARVTAIVILTVRVNALICYENDESVSISINNNNFDEN